MNSEKMSFEGPNKKKTSDPLEVLQNAISKRIKRFKPAGWERLINKAEDTDDTALDKIDRDYVKKVTENEARQKQIAFEMMQIEEKRQKILEAFNKNYDLIEELSNRPPQTKEEFDANEKFQSMSDQTEELDKRVEKLTEESQELLASTRRAFSEKDINSTQHN